uniref:N-acetyltransferase domain-containing protein n=1 Tax=Arion vulgaris TaxID=1028688 RepID=A0A0B6ZEZ0_9EUPU
MECTFSCCAYCWKNEDSWDQLICFKCDGCQKRVHYDCIRSAQPSPLLGDTFFHFKCDACGDAGKEEFVRSNISWHNVVMLALYNLHKTSQGRCGYFHWKGHIGNFIDQHWNTFFGYQRKKTTVWMGTVAGTLSIGCPEYFLSGTQIGQQGHWRLSKVEPPLFNTEKKKQSHRKKIKVADVELNPDKRKCRRVGESALSAAVELKEKRSSLLEKKELKKPRCTQHDESLATLRETDDLSASSSRKRGHQKTKTKKSSQKSLSMADQLAQSLNTGILNCSTDELYLSDSSNSIANTSFWSTKSSMKGDNTTAQFQNVDHIEDPIWMTEIKDEDLDLEFLVTENSLDPRAPSPDVDIFLNADLGHTSYGMPGKSPVSVAKTTSEDLKQELVSETESECRSEKNVGDDSTSDSEEEEEEEKRTEHDSENEEQERVVQIKQEFIDLSHMPESSSEKHKPRCPHKRRKVDDTPPPTPPMQLKRISLFEEGELLQKLNDVAVKQTLRPELAQLRRKLICNQTNREFGLPVFDLENQMNKLAKLDKTSSVPDSQDKPNAQYLPTKIAKTKETRDLDRFMIHDSKKKTESRSYTNFYQRLVGLRDDELTPVISPYTTRVLLPFIWRNFDISHKPMKLKLLQEIQAFPHRNKPTWVQPHSAPLDYCYIRPEHVPSVNALCREFFWPGIDVSECLQYPDFSCVVLYRKIVVAFAFMVPDRGYNEAYISFIFTHPEWRGAGIGTFMLYHLIQTCMGKDVLLHVSVNNPAMLLYQKFGFKCQELILNFYYKYFPFNSKESTHAFLMRLSR